MQDQTRDGVARALPAHRPQGTADLAHLARVLATRRAFWEPLVRFDPGSRWFARVAGGEGWEAWLHTWSPGRTSGAHDHGRSASALVVLRGTLLESQGHDEGTTARRLGVDDVSTLPAGSTHTLVGAPGGPTISLHVYAPPLPHSS